MNLRSFKRYSARLGFPMSSALGLLGLYMLANLFETIGVVMMLPVLQYVERGGDTGALIADSRLWQWLDRATAFLHVPLGLATLLSAAFACVLARQAVFYWRMVRVVRLQEELQERIRNSGFESYLRANSRYHDHVAVGDVINALTVETRRAAVTIMAPVELTGYVLLFAVYLTFLFALSMEMTLIAMVILVAATWFLRGVMARSHDVGRAVAEANKRMSAFLAQRLKSPRLIRLSGIEVAETQAMSRLTEAQRQNMVRIGRLTAQAGVAVEPIVVAIGFGFLYVAVTVFQLALGSISLFLLILLRLLPLARSVLASRQSMLAGMGSLEAVARRLDEMEATQERNEGGRIFERLEKGILFDEVVFSYDGGKIPALDGVSLRIPARSVTALVGPTGSGKSTMIDMLPRLREPNSGRITIDDHPLEDFECASLRRGIAFAPQAPDILNVSVAQHIRFGKPAATEAELRRAADLAGAMEFIERLPEGFETPLGEAGIRLSGGQRQRLDLARALVSGAPVLILDEPTSNLDAEAEDRFRRVLRRIREETDMTVIIVGHRLSTVANADRIVVLRNGRVEDVAPHAELMRRGGWYARAYRKQHGESDTAPDPSVAAEAQGSASPRARLR